MDFVTCNTYDTYNAYFTDGKTKTHKSWLPV